LMFQFFIHVFWLEVLSISSLFFEFVTRKVKKK
jgi:hypothetical protein